MSLHHKIENGDCVYVVTPSMRIVARVVGVDNVTIALTNVLEVSNYNQDAFTSNRNGRPQVFNANKIEVRTMFVPWAKMEYLCVINAPDGMETADTTPTE
jgi:hypothetical protein